MSRSMKRLSLVLLAIGSAPPLVAQAILPKRPTTTPIVIAAPTSLTATGGQSSILLAFPAVAAADGYRVTRTNNAGQPETTIYEGAAATFSFQGAACAPPSGCAYTDAAANRGYLYSYRVYSLFPNAGGPPMVSGPSPVASAQLKLMKARP